MNTCVSVFHKITDTSSVTAGRVMSPAPIATGAPRSQKGDVAEKMILKNSGAGNSARPTFCATGDRPIAPSQPRGQRRNQVPVDELMLKVVRSKRQKTARSFWTSGF